MSFLDEIIWKFHLYFEFSDNLSFPNAAKNFDYFPTFTQFITAIKFQTPPTILLIRRRILYLTEKNENQFQKNLLPTTSASVWTIWKKHYHTQTNINTNTNDKSKIMTWHHHIRPYIAPVPSMVPLNSHPFYEFLLRNRRKPKKYQKLIRIGYVKINTNNSFVVVFNA